MIDKMTYEARDLFVVLSNSDDEMAERIMSGDAFTWEIYQIVQAFAAHRENAKAALVSEIVAWMRGNCMSGKWRVLASEIEEKWGKQ